MCSITNKGPIIDSGQCRCCGLIKRCRLLNVEYQWFQQKEVYTEMFFDCYGLLLSNLDGETEERLICATCVTRLREANCFRIQVIECEEKLLRLKLQGENDSSINPNKEIKEEKPKEEICPLSDHDLDGVDIDNSHEGLEITEVTEVLGATSPKRGRKKIKSDINLEESCVILNKKIKGAGPKKEICALSDNNLRDIKTDNSNELEGTNSLKRKSKKSKSEKEKDRNRGVGLKSKTEKKPSHKTKVQSYGKKPDGSAVKNSFKTVHNIFTIVENSYVCPFDTSFSDYYCIYCRQIFTDPNKLREHSLTHDPKTFENVYVTNRKVKIDISRIDCRLCSTKIDDLETLKIHLTHIHEKTVYNVSDDILKFRLTTGTLFCLECNANFNFFHALKKHMAEHFGTLICDICGAHYFEERMLILHQKTHQKVDEYFQCEECGKTFKSKYWRQIHIARMHKKEAVYQCSNCDEVFFSYTIRYRHMIEAHGVERMFKCDQCDRAYNSRKSLREHCRRSHLKIQKHQCDLCDKRFYLPSRLKEHMVSHTGERNFRCEYCGKCYPRLRGLKVHMQSHIGEKKYKCTLCDASFAQNVQLKNHMNKQHQNIELNDNNFIE